MDKNKLFKIANNKDEKLLISRLIDVYEGAENTGYVRCSKFLNGREQNIATYIFNALRANFAFFGGYDEAERKVAVCYSDDVFKDIFEIPVKLLILTGNDNCSDINHRDYLGSLTGLGIKREMFGDIICDETGAKIFALEEIAQYVSQQLDKVGKHRMGITVTDPGDIEIPQKKFKILSYTVGSPRLDAVISGCCGVSRSNACDLINSGRVTVNWEEVSSISKACENGDIMSVKGYGRFRLDEIGGETRKGRIFVKVKKFI